MSLYRRIAATVEEGGMPLLLRKVWMKFLVGYDKNFFFHAMPKGFPAGTLTVNFIKTEPKDIVLAERILKAFSMASAEEAKFSPQKSYRDAWDDNRNMYHADLLEILSSGDSRRLADYLSNMHMQKSTYGVSGNITEFKRLSSSPSLRKKEVAWLKDVLVSCAEALGILPYETVVPYVAKNNIYQDPDWMVGEIEKKMGIKIAPPEVEGGLFKLNLKHGRFDFRDIWSLYAAWRISAVADKDAPIGEIGGGLGKVALYAHRFGLRDYSIFDLPIMNVMTAWYLIKGLPDINIVLYGEPDQGKAVRVLPYWSFANKKYGLVLNQDSFPEMGREIVEGYLRDIQKNSKYLLTINHEHQAPLFSGADHRNLVVPKIIEEVGEFKRIYRFPYWLRKGYVEELYEVALQGDRESK